MMLFSFSAHIAGLHSHTPSRNAANPSRSTVSAGTQVGGYVAVTGVGGVQAHPTGGDGLVKVFSIAL